MLGIGNVKTGRIFRGEISVHWVGIIARRDLVGQLGLVGITCGMSGGNDTAGEGLRIQRCPAIECQSVGVRQNSTTAHVTDRLLGFFEVLLESNLLPAIMLGKIAAR